jgi:parvulin-like peptidyl-prolyl isomerase
MRLRHILVRHEYEARDLERKIESGSSFEDLARKFSLCPSREAGGDLGDLNGKLSRLDEDFLEAAKSLKAGERSGPVRTRFGYHLIIRIQ